MIPHHWERHVSRLCLHHLQGVYPGKPWLLMETIFIKIKSQFQAAACVRHPLFLHREKHLPAFLLHVVSLP